MYEGRAPFGADPQTEYRRRPLESRYRERPDRIALWAVVMAVIAMVAAATSAQAGSGGLTRTGGECRSLQFGDRALDFGDCGGDVKTLNWILKGKEYGVPLDRDFRDRTDRSVREFQRRHGLNVSGVVRDPTRRRIVHSMRRSIATWYGPGFFGNRTACGQTLRRRTLGVAHRTLPCGTKVVLGYQGRYIRTRVIDRGPYANDANWDLTARTAQRLNFQYTDTLRAVAVR